MRLILLVTDLERGGTPLRLARLACDLRRAGLDVHVGCLAPPGPVSRELDAAGVPTFACNARNPRDFAALFRLYRHIRRIRPALIHATLTHANVAARLIGRLTGIPVLTSTATIEVERRWHAFAERFTARLDRGHIVSSSAIADHVARTFRLPRSRIHLVPPSIDLRAFSIAGFDQPGEKLETRIPLRLREETGSGSSAAARLVTRAELNIPDRTFLILWAGRLDPVKRLHIVLAAAELLAAPDYAFIIAGDGPDRANFERQLRRSRAANVRWLGWRDDLPRLMSAADAFLFPSLTEGMPNAVLQAMAAGLPIIASDIPALRELRGSAAPHLRRCLLVPSAQPRDYAAALHQLRSNPQERSALTARAVAWAAAHLDPQKTTRVLLALYERTLTKREPS